MSAIARSQVPGYGMRRHCCELSGTTADCAGVKRRLARRQVSRVSATQESGFFILGGRRPRWPQRRASANYVGLMQILAAGPEIGLASQRLRIILYAPWYDIPHSFNPGIVHLAAGVVTLSRKK